MGNKLVKTKKCVLKQNVFEFRNPDKQFHSGKVSRSDYKQIDGVLLRQGRRDSIQKSGSDFVIINKEKILQQNVEFLEGERISEIY